MLLCGPCGKLVDTTHVCPYGCTKFLQSSAYSCAPRACGPPADYVSLFGSDEEERLELSQNVAKQAAAAAAAPSRSTVDDATRFFNTILQSHDDLTQKNIKLNSSVEHATSNAQLLTSQRVAAEQERDAAKKERDAANKVVADKERELSTLKRKLDEKPACEKPSCEVVYTNIVNLVTSHYTAKANKMKANFKPPAPPPPPPAPPPAPPAPKPGPHVQMIIQKNSNPSYHTEREIKYEATGADDELFYFDSGLTPWQPNWTAMDATLSAQIATTLGVVSANKRVFTANTGCATQYTYGQHSYDVAVVMRPYPVAPPPPPPKPPPPPPPPTPTVPWQVQVLFEGEFAKLDKTTVENWLSQYDFSAESFKAKNGGPCVASLAELFTSFGTPFQFDSKKSELWIKPHWLKTWLLSVVKRGYTEARILMHGMKEGPYESLFDDHSGCNPMMSGSTNAMGHGFYASASNEIAAQYGRRALIRGTTGARHNYGTALIGLILTTPGQCSDPKRGVDNGALAYYPLANTVGAQVKYPSSGQSIWNDAFCVRDQTIWLPLGLAYAKK